MVAVSRSEMNAASTSPYQQVGAGGRIDRRTIIVGGDDPVSTLATTALRQRGGEVLRVGLEGGSLPVDVKLDVTDDKAWLALHQDRRLHEEANFLYTVGYGEPSVFALSDGSTIGQHAAVNLQGLQNFYGFLARREHPHESCSVVVVTSLNSRIAVPGYSGYCATKAGAAMLSRVAAIELAPSYRVNMVAPGPFRSNATADGAKDVRRAPGLIRQHLLDKRLTAVSDVWQVVDFLLSDGSSWMTGCEIPVDGGLHLLGTLG
jgi:NAD(P)-dependent dehydrogenase (short-subunit alcohol dehydrogenase family)